MQRGSHHVRVAAELALPVEHANVVTPRSVLAGQERAPQHRLRPIELKISGRDVGGGRHFGQIDSRQLELVERNGLDLFEGSGPAPPSAHGAAARAVVAVERPAPLPDRHQLPGLVSRQRAQQPCVHYRKQRRIQPA